MPTAGKLVGVSIEAPNHACGDHVQMPWTEDDEAAHKAFNEYVEAKERVDKSLNITDARKAAKLWSTFLGLYDKALRRGSKVITFGGKRKAG